MVARTTALVMGLLVTAIFLVSALTRAETPAAPPEPAGTFKAGEYLLSGPYTHENLTLYLIHGPDRLKGKHYVTLQQAIQDKIVVIYETGNVNELQIENVSSDVDVYLQAGDIIKGGRQDRTIATDGIIPPKSGKAPLEAFCVEHGRWSRRAGEDAAAFGSSANAVSGKSLKMAVQKSANQGEVWREVAQNQAKLSSNAGASVNDPRSASSYELSLENKRVQEATEAYSKKLGKIAEGQADAIGYVTVINGKVSSADAYASRELFLKLWPKLMHSAEVEAFAELQKEKKFDPIKPEAVAAAIEDADKGTASSKNVNPRVELVTHESKDNIVFETRDRSAGAAAAPAWIHRSYINKEGTTPTPAPDVNIQRQQINAPPNPDLNQRNAPQQQPPQPAQEQKQVQEQRK